MTDSGPYDSDTVFTDAQWRTLVEHLQTEFGDAAEGIADCIEVDAAAYVRTWDENGATAAELREWRKYYEDQAAALWQVICGLHETHMGGMHTQNISERDLVHRYRDCLAAAAGNTRSRGSPTKTGRDRLIRAIAQTYGPDAKKTRNSHFVRTVALVLDCLDRAPGDVHRTVVSALA